MSTDTKNSPPAPRKIKSPQDLADIREKALAAIDLRSGPKDMRITVHMGTCGIAAGAREILMELVAQLADQPSANVSVQQAGCCGLCDKEPMVTLSDREGGTFRYGRLDRKKVREIVHRHVLGGATVTECLISQ